VQPRRSLQSTDLFLLALVVVLSAVMGRSLHHKARQIAALEQDHARLRQALADTARQRRKLLNEREALLTDPVFIEKQARESLRLRREGEVVLAPEPGTAAPDHAPGAAERPGPWNRALRWRFFPVVFTLGAAHF
jgi:cell division protein FtsB